MLKNRRAKIAAMSRRFPPEYKRLWYVVESRKGFRIRFKGITIPYYFPSFYKALEMVDIFRQTRVI